MVFERSLFGASYPRTEVDLRKEFDDFVFGKSGGIPHNHKSLIRRIRRNSSNQPIQCDCVNHLTNEPDTESKCPFCLGEKHYWDESFITCYSVMVGADGGNANRTRRLQLGEIRADYRIFYFRYDTKFTYKDKIIELKLDTEGVPTIPYKRDVIYRPETIRNYRSDNGRLEYIAIYCREEDALRLND